jgi:hypothetical protein
LAHDGYVETARAFAEEVNEEARALANDDNEAIPYIAAEEDLDAINRQSMFNQFHEGSNIDVTPTRNPSSNPRRRY